MKYLYQFLCMLLAVCLCSTPLMAAAQNLTLSSYQIEVTYPSVDGIAPPTPVSGAELSIYLVARLNTNRDYELLPAFSSLDISGLADMNASELEEEAEKFSFLIEQQEIVPDATLVTDENGIVVFRSVTKQGLYLTKQTGKTGQAEKYSSISPYLIQIPYFDHAVGWIYDVQTEPKLKVAGEEMTETTETTAQTSTETTVQTLAETTTVQTFTETALKTSIQTMNRETPAQSTTAARITQTVNVPQENSTPKTSDEEHLSFWIALFAGSLLGFLFMLGTLAKRSDSREKP